MWSKTCDKDLGNSANSQTKRVICFLKLVNENKICTTSLVLCLHIAPLRHMLRITTTCKHFKVMYQRVGPTGKSGARLIRTSWSTPEKEGSSLGSGNKKRRASSSKQARVSPTANTNTLLVLFDKGHSGCNPVNGRQVKECAHIVC